MDVIRIVGEDPRVMLPLSFSALASSRMLARMMSDVSQWQERGNRVITLPHIKVGPILSLNPHLPY
jgi:hypothetical protein